MQKKKVLLATAIGIVLFITDFITGWIGLTLGIPAILIIVFIVGVISGDGVSGFVAGILTEFLGIFILAIIPQILIPGYFETSDILSRMWIIMMISVAYGFRFASGPMPLIEALVGILLLLILAPLIFLMALVLGPIGGVIGKAIYERLSGPSQPERVERSPSSTSGMALQSSVSPPEDVLEQHEFETESPSTESEDDETIGMQDNAFEDSDE